VIIELLSAPEKVTTTRGKSRNPQKSQFSACTNTHFKPTRLENHGKNGSFNPKLSELKILRVWILKIFFHEKNPIRRVFHGLFQLFLFPFSQSFYCFSRFLERTFFHETYVSEKAVNQLSVSNAENHRFCHPRPKGRH